MPLHSPRRHSTSSTAPVRCVSCRHRGSFSKV